MRKSTFLSIFAVIIAIFIVYSFGKKQVLYEKKENFKTPEEAIVNFIGYINTYEMVKVDNGSYSVPSREFLESISKRYRLYISGNTYKFLSSPIPVFFNYELEELDYNSVDNIKFNYENSFKNISSYANHKNPRLYKLSGDSGYTGDVEKSDVNEDGTVDNVGNYERVPRVIYLIAIDEGEGYVVDYYEIIS